VTCRDCAARLRQVEDSRRRAHRLSGTNGALMNEVDRLRRRVAELEGCEPPPASESWLAGEVSAADVDWGRAEVLRLPSGDQPWRVVDHRHFEVNVLVPYPGDVALPPYWAPLAFRHRRDAEAEVARRQGLTD